MRFNPKARLDTERVGDSGQGGGGLGGGTGGIQIPGGAKAGGGLGMVVIVLLVLVLGQCGGVDVTGGQLPSSNQLDTSRMVGADTGRYDNCKTGEDANNSEDCARVAVENALTSYWSQTVPQQAGIAFRPVTGVQTFTGGVNTGCGAASSQMGPFYCPADETIYLDTSFYPDVLQRQLNGPAGEFVPDYVLAHEYGHHIQNVLGTMGQVRTQKGANSDAVRLELQADCYAGMWAKGVQSATDADGVQLVSDPPSEEDMSQAIEAARAVGDDRIQDITQGRVDPDQWTHGSAAARVKWFMTGYDTESMRSCDTFAVDRVE